MSEPGVRVAAIVLAAGEGKRLKSALPKVLHRLAGRTLVGHALAAVSAAGVSDIVAVVSDRREEIDQALRAEGLKDVTLAVQDPPRGTGDAVQVGLTAVSDAEVVLVTNGDSPLLEASTVTRMLEAHATSKAAATLLTAHAGPNSDAGRVLREASGAVARIVEAKDASPAELEVTEINAGFYVFDAALLRDALQKIQPANAQGEYYLTDVIAILRDGGAEVHAVVGTWEEVQGVNDRGQLAEAGRVLRQRTAERWMAEGVTIVDPASTFIDASVTIERDATIHPFTFLEGKTHISSGAVVGPQVRLVDSTVGPGAEVTFAVVKGSEIGAEASVGPFASLRPGTKVGRGARLGTFVETKNTVIGEDSKANHLSYLGDARIGRGVNIGAGTITCNWDGQNKHETVIEDDAYISSDTMLVAPLTIGERAATGAGSVVRDDVPADALAVGVPARIVPGKGNKMKSSKGDGSG